MLQNRTACYPLALIRAFARSQRNLEEAMPLDASEVRKDYFLADRVQGGVDLIWRFNDDFLSEHSPSPALAFQKYDTSDYGEETRYTLVYLDPSLTSLWKHDMSEHAEKCD